MENEARVAFVSGANRGIGFGLTLDMAQHGCKVAAGYRDETKSTELLAEAEKHGNILPVKVDVTIEEDLRHLYQFIDNHLGHLNILVNSAGVNVNESAQVNELQWQVTVKIQLIWFIYLKHDRIDFIPYIYIESVP